MKIALLQPDVMSGDLEGNAGLLLELAHKEPADLCVAPAEALAGPGAACLAHIPGRSAAVAEALRKLAAPLARGPALLCALPALGPILIQDGAVEPVGGFFYFCGSGIAVDRCPSDSEGCDFCVFISSRPYSPDSQLELELELSGAARRAQLPAFAANLCGGYGSQIYSGQSSAFDASGNLKARGKAFAQDVVHIDLDDLDAAAVAPEPPCIEAAQWAALTLGLADFVHKAGASQALLGLSGGMDSSLVAAIAADALGADNVTGVLLPSRYTSRESIEDAEALARSLGIKTLAAPIEPMLAAFEQALAPAFAALPSVANDLTMENLQARVRGVALMALANRSGALVLNTGNKSEGAMGYCTLYGDTAGAVAVIGDLFKTQVYALAAWRNAQAGRMLIPQNVFDKAPSAELRPNQKDTDSLPPYAELDPQLARLLSGDASMADSAELRKLRRRVAASEFKRRQSPPPLLISGMPLSGFCSVI